ncbi:IS3 family transposase [Lysinibacillus sp. FSL H8-0500]|uniref:IS3 family transposase n=1 Tax=Lysinibacillus sp. FSL H8-0500 TaxID=2921393 RepID=UPI0031012339
MAKLRKKYTVTLILEVLDIPRATYYRWAKEGVDEHSPIETAIITLCEKTKYRYGHRKIKHLLHKEYGYQLNRNTVQKWMQKHNLQCRVKKKRRFKADQGPEIIAPNLLARSFTATAPNEKWVTDITYIQYGSTTMYLATVLDLYNNEIVAYKLYDHQQTPLVMDVLKAALEARNDPKGVIVHSDQGSVYTSYAYQNLLEEMKCRPSMSRRGNCWDNAVIESFHSNIKTEEFQRVKHHSLTNEETRLRVIKYMKEYNEERIQEKLGYLTPLEFGKQAA